MSSGTPQTGGGRVAGRLVIVTGAAQGQGAAEVAALVAEGASVIGLDLHQPDEPVPGVDYRVADVSSAEGWHELADALSAQNRIVHGLVNNAGITSRVRLADVTPEEMNRVMAINVTGPLLGMQTIAPLMKEGGSIVNVCSIAAWTGHFPAAYTASKWALRGLSRTAATELGRDGIRVNAIMPGVSRLPWRPLRQRY